MITAILLLSTLLAAAPSAHPPQDVGITFRVKSDLVLVDVLVLDREGHFIEDLDAKNFTLTEDGKKQQILFLELVKKGLTGKTTDRASAPPVRQHDRGGGSLEFASPAEGVSLVILLDLNSISPNSFLRVRQSLSRFFDRQFNDADRIMLATIDTRLRVVQNLSAEPESIFEALDRMHLKTNTQTLDGQFSSLIDRIDRIFRTAEHSATPIEAPIDEASALANSFLALLTRNLSAASQAIDTLSDALRSVQGRKHIIYYSSGYPLNAPKVIDQLIEQRAAASLGRGGRLQSASLRQRLSVALGNMGGKGLYRTAQETIDDANRSQVSIYSIDVRGLMAKSGMGDASVQGSQSMIRRGQSVQYDMADISAPQEFLVSLASGTGGLAFLNNNDLGRGIRRAYSDMHEYYLIGYRPTTKRKKGKLHKIQLKINRPGSRIRYRRGYLDRDTEQFAHREIFNASNTRACSSVFPSRPP